MGNVKFYKKANVMRVAEWRLYESQSANPAGTLFLLPSRQIVLKLLSRTGRDWLCKCKHSTFWGNR